MFKIFPLAIPTLAFVLSGKAHAIECDRYLRGESILLASNENRADAGIQRSVYNRVAISSHGSLYYSHLAEQKAKILDDMIVNLRTAIEVGVVGLTRTEGSDVFVEDFVVPASDKIFIIERLFSSKELGELGRALGDSKRLQLEVDQGNLVIKSDNSKYHIIVKPALWGEIAEPLSRACNCQISGDYNATLTKVSEMGPIQLRTDWELIISGLSVDIAQSYFDRVEQEASRKGLHAKFNMHHHPRLGLAVISLSDKSMATKQAYFNELLVPSLPDLHFMDSVEADWFEIRSFGTLYDLRSDRTTAKFYDMREIREYKGHIANVVQKLLDPNSGKTLSELSRLTQEIEGIVQWVSARNLSAPNVVEYAIGTDKFRELKAEANSTSEPSGGKGKLISQLVKD